MSEQFIALHKENCSPAFQIHCQSHPLPWSEGVFKSCLQDQYFASALVRDESTLGYFVGLQVLDEFTLMDIAVHHDNRRQGLGDTLLKQFVAICLQGGASKIWLEVRASNHPAIALYQRNGFVVTETRKGYYHRDHQNEDALVMCLIEN